VDEGWESHHGGPMEANRGERGRGQGPRPCSREGVRRG